VLFVCTGNICRSATAEGFALREMARLPGAPLRFSSAGCYALEGNRAVGHAVAAAAARGASLEGHRARQLTRRRVVAADVILCMAAEHRPAVLALDRTAARRTFLLAPFARAAARGASLASSPAELVALAADRVRELPGDEVDDPYGGPAAAYTASAERLDRLVATVVAALARTLDPSGGPAATMGLARGSSGRGTVPPEPPGRAPA